MKYYKITCLNWAMEKYFFDPEAAVEIGGIIAFRQSPKHRKLLEVLDNITNSEFLNNPPFIFELEEETDLTDVLRGANIQAQGFFVSKKAKSLLEKFNLGIHRFYDAKIFDKDVEHNYYWLHLIDIDARRFYPNRNFSDVPLKEIIYNLPKSYCNLDLFKIIGSAKIVASQKLIDAIIQGNIIGFNYKEVKNI